jgi:hypothetical protein
MEAQKIMAANELARSKAVRSKAAAEILKRQESINKLADDTSEQYALSILAFAADMDSNKLTELHAFLKERPHLKGLPYLADDTLQALTNNAGMGMGSAVLIGQETEVMIKELTLDSDGPLERLMVVRVVMTWLRLMYSENYKTSLMKCGASMHQIEHADKELSRAHTRYIRSIEALARVRKLVRIAEMADTQSQLLKERLIKQSKPRLALAPEKAKGA